MSRPVGTRASWEEACLELERGSHPAGCTGQGMVLAGRSAQRHCLHLGQPPSLPRLRPCPRAAAHVCPARSTVPWSHLPRPPGAAVLISFSRALTACVPLGALSVLPARTGSSWVAGSMPVSFTLVLNRQPRENRERHTEAAAGRTKPRAALKAGCGVL